jgi:alkylhydroperoxidase family enzyme
MARVRLLEPREVPEPYRPQSTRGPLSDGSFSNLTRLLWLSPKLGQHVQGMAQHILRELRLKTRYRELATLAAARACNCAFVYLHHVHLAPSLCMTAEEVAAFPMAGESPLFSAEDRAVIRFADESTRDVRVSDETFAAVRAFLDEDEVLELLATVCLYNTIARLIVGFGLGPDTGEPDWSTH